MKIIRSVYFHTKRPRYMVQNGDRAAGFGDLRNAELARKMLEDGSTVWESYIDQPVPDDAVVVNL